MKSSLKFLGVELKESERYLDDNGRNQIVFLDSFNKNEQMISIKVSSRNGFNYTHYTVRVGNVYCGMSMNLSVLEIAAKEAIKTEKNKVTKFINFCDKNKIV